MAKKKSVAVNITLEQFKSWLQGVEDMQSDDWAPNADQWKVIREKIDLIISREDSIPQLNQNLPQYNGGFVPPPTYMPPLPPMVRPAMETAVIVDNTGQQTTIAVQPASTRSEFE